MDDNGNELYIKLSRVPEGVRKWGKGLFVYKGDDREVTHLCLDGGRLHVSKDREDWFHIKLGVDIARQVRNYVVERRTPVFRFHADIDLFEPKVRDMDSILSWIRDDMLSVLRECYPQFAASNYDELLVLVSETEPKRGVKKYGSVYDKVGVHLLFPRLLITKEMAWLLRSAFIQYFKLKYGDREDGYNEWADVFDKTVYCGNGLRMLGCAKTEKCLKCKGITRRDTGGDDEDICGACDGMGKLDIGRVYRICNVINGDGSDNGDVLDELSSDEIEMVRMSSIRSHVKIEDVPELSYPVWFDSKLQFDVDVTGGGKGVKGTNNKKRTNVVYNREDRVRLSDDDIRVKKIIEWFGNDNLHELFLIPKEYRNVKIEDVTMCTPVNDGVFSRFYLIQVSSSYCMNLGSTHSSNSVYFVVNGDGIFQKCFCRCNTLDGRLSGKRCENYRSESFEIPDDLEYLLFPREEDNKRMEYCGFMEECNNSLSCIKDEKSLLDRLLSDALMH